MQTRISHNQQHNSQRLQQSNHSSQLFRFGKLPLNYFLYFFIPLLIFACLFSYSTAVITKEQKPFPHTTITNMSRFYPQDLVFRYIMLPAGGFISLIYFVLFKWLKKLKKVVDYPFKTWQQLQKLGQISILGFYAAVSTIDGGSLPNIHIIGAVLFFVVLFLIATVVSIVLADMRQWCTQLVTRWSAFLKLGIAVYLIIVVLYSILLSRKDTINQDEPPIVIAQWNLVIGGLIWLFTFKTEWKGVNLVLIGKSNETFRKQSEDQSQVQHCDRI